MPEYNSAVLLELLDGCLRANRRSQELLYKQFYGYAMGICMRYTHNREEAREILNDGFLKVLTRLESFDRERSFKAWLGRIMINTALDHYRHEARQPVFEDVQVAESLYVNEVALSQHPDWWLRTLQAAWPNDWPSIIAAGNGPPPMALRPPQILSNRQNRERPERAKGVILDP